MDMGEFRSKRLSNTSPAHRAMHAQNTSVLALHAAETIALLEAVWSQSFYLFAQHESSPLLNKKYTHPRKRMNDNAAVAHNSARKKLAVRVVAPEENPNLSKLSDVIATASNAFEKIQNVTRRVRKDLYESSSVFFVSSLGATYGVRARLTVCSN